VESQCPHEREAVDPVQASTSCRGGRQCGGPLHPADACGQFRTEEATIGGLVRDPADGRETQADRGGCVLALLKVNAVAQDHRAVEREAGLRAVPSDELADGVVVRTLPAGGHEAVEHRSLGVLEIKRVRGANEMTTRLPSASRLMMVGVRGRCGSASC